MKLPKLSSPFAGMPDGQVQMPLKPVRLTLQPEEALTLYVALESLMSGLDQAKPSERQAQLLLVIGEIHGKLLDRLEVTFPA